LPPVARRGRFSPRPLDAATCTSAGRPTRRPDLGVEDTRLATHADLPIARTIDVIDVRARTGHVPLLVQGESERDPSVGYRICLDAAARDRMTL
jgi:hypothetical protein